MRKVGEMIPLGHPAKLVIMYEEKEKYNPWLFYKVWKDDSGKAHRKKVTARADLTSCIYDIVDLIKQ